ncbi:hypothetical protein [Actinomycetospora termitidis]|uniref:Uncharacterized protein n=1 Tax=Actinomycetospora termitidis TaxID=3053470 RepID=A0ABT7MI60_9PSEU|nr:hypothetical protein [Actinomycetospora sp. Odt1-22]MDL5160136.1 hypothetical protein [Actinomycetospora sp. Odt1-22]
MSVVGVGWGLFAAFVVLLGLRVVVTEAVRPTYRVEAGPRRVVRTMDVALVVVLVALAAALLAVIGPPLLAR